MLKNLSMGKKLAYSFGCVILLLLIVVAITIVTSVQRNNDLERMNIMTDLQISANDMLDSFSEARVAASYASTVLDAEAYYVTFFAQIADAQRHLTEMDEYSTALAEYDSDMSASFLQVNSQLRTMLEGLVTSFGEIQANDSIVSDSIATMTDASLSLVESADELYAIASGLDDETAASVHQLALDIDTMRVESATMIIGLDPSVSESLKSRLDAISEAAEELRSAFTGSGAAALASIQTAIENYNAAMDELLESMYASLSIIDSAGTAMDETLGLITDGITVIEGDVDTTTDDTIATSNQALITIIVVAVIAVVASLIVEVILSRLITRPLAKMRSIMKQAGEVGDLSFSDEVRDDILREAEAKDELGQSIGAFAQLIDRIRYIGEILEGVAAGDLTRDVQLLSERDTLGHALQTMTDNLNNMFMEIHNVSGQVAASSGEIATGAQSLAQGASEQAATVEEISATITEITTQSEVSVHTAEDAAADGMRIRDIALEGNEKMNHMMQAVQEINNASQSIEKVIKSIDDIAFQTNILALNAAVEAARAGQHGKGFAVVADEVRNLAGKSAEAASETSNLISENIKTAGSGLAIAKETAESLEKIMAGIQRTSESLLTIAEQSRGAQSATAQVNSAVDQVAQVVQQNSATSEESAAASEQMSSQAQVLRELIARFRLRGSKGVAADAAARGSEPIDAAETMDTGMAVDW